MIRIEFTEEAIKKLRYERFHHPHPRVQLKMEALLLKSEGLAHGQICRLLGISENTLRAYFREFLAGGVEKLKELKFFKPESDLAAHRETLEAYFREHPPASVKEAAAKIEQMTGIRRGLTQVRQFLKSLGMRRLKVGFVPAKADAEEQERFKKRGTSTAAGRGAKRSPRGVLRGRSAFRAGAVFGLPLVFRAARGPRAGGPPAVQRAGRLERDYARVGRGDQ
jgi:transposase